MKRRCILNNLNLIKKGDTIMRKSITKTAKPSRAMNYEVLEEVVRMKVQQFIQDILEEEVNEFLCRKKSERIKGIDAPRGYRNGYGRPRKFALMAGTVTIRRPRLRGTDEHFESKVLPLFKRRSKELAEMLPELYLHGLAKGDFVFLKYKGIIGIVIMSFLTAQLFKNIVWPTAIKYINITVIYIVFISLGIKYLEIKKK
jgi:hypothetical protein